MEVEDVDKLVEAEVDAEVLETDVLNDVEALVELVEIEVEAEVELVDVE